jgi:pyrroline-5-carboxylate reductase
MTYRIGIIGVGIIGEPFVRGLVRAHGSDVAVYLSPRNPERVARLVAEFENVHACASNQEVADRCDWVVLALLGDAAEVIIRSVIFRSDQRVITVIAAASISDIQQWTGCSAVHKLIPLPYVAFCTGPLAAFPVTPELTDVVGRLGALAVPDDEAGLDVMSTITSTQSAFFATIAEVAGWAADHKLNPAVAQRFTLDFLSALVFKAGTLTPSELTDHWREMTPGGLNHTAMTSLRDAGAIEAWSAAMDAVAARR